MSSSAFIFGCPPVSMSANPSTSSYKCSRRQFLSVSATSLLSLSIASSAANAAASPSPNQQKDFETSSLRQFDTLQQIEPVVRDSTSLDTFVTDLKERSIKQVWFFGHQNQNCFYERKDGSILRVTEGFPKEAPGSPESPLQLMARVRDL